MARNDAAAPDHVCPGIRIQAIDIVQSPGIGIWPIAAMDEHQTVVTVTLDAKSSAETPSKARSEICAETKRGEFSSPQVASTMSMLWFIAFGIRRGEATRRPPRYGP